mgnify:CR=1 FL=1
MTPSASADTVRTVTRIAKALGDPQRLRALMALRGGEMCVCALIAFLKLAPSTVSKHMRVLEDAGLVVPRKVGRWVHYRLAGRSAPPEVRAILLAVCRALAHDQRLARDARCAARIRRTDHQQLSRCYKN